MAKVKLKFWDKEENKMLDSYLSDRYYLVSFEGLALIDTWRDDEDGYLYEMDVEFLDSKGVEDINGEEIFEGDIVEVKYNNPLTGKATVDRYKIETQENTLIKMVHASGEPRWDRYLHMQYKECEVIGNIYENPELLELIPNE